VRAVRSQWNIFGQSLQRIQRCPVPFHQFRCRRFRRPVRLGHGRQVTAGRRRRRLRHSLTVVLTVVLTAVATAVAVTVRMAARFAAR